MRTLIMAGMLCTLTGMTSCVPTIGYHPTRIRWTQEPVIGVDDAGLVAPTQAAIDMWGWGVLSPRGCEGVNICIKRGFLEPDGPTGRATWVRWRQRCNVEILRPFREAVVIAHELGHCYGLGHSVDSRSVMYRQISVDGPHYVTFQDADLLTEIRRGR